MNDITIANFLISPLRRTCLPAILALHGAVSAAQPQDLTTVPFEQLLSMEVYSASKFVQKASSAPATVTVITAADIRDYGWRTLGDIARSVRGMYVSYDRNYSYLGERGFMRPGDYNTRFLLQVDGNRINDSVYDQAPVGMEFPLDLDMIERIEFVPGPGSSIYGSNAFFGVINVITKQAADHAGTTAAVEVGSARTRKAGLTHAWRDSGGSYLISASSYRSAGRDLYFPEYDNARQNHGVAEGLDYERTRRVFASATRGRLNLALIHAERIKGVPTASFGQPFNDPRSRTVDRQTYVNAVVRDRIGAAEQGTARLFFGNYDSSGDYVIDNAARTLNHDGSAAHWWGAELSMVSTRFAGHTILAGLDLQNDYRLHQYSFDVEPYVSYLDANNKGRRSGVYVQDEIALGDALLVNLGLRYDRNSNMRGVFSPRAALIYQLAPDTTIKAIRGSAFRAPNSYELYYAFAGQSGQNANPNLGREHVRSSELTLSHRFGAQSRMTATAFRVDVAGLITQTLDAATDVTRFDNATALDARGVELEYERTWRGGAHLRTSVSRVKLGPDAPGQQINAPVHLAKLNYSTPLGASGLRAAIEQQYVGARRTLTGSAGAYWLVNANLTATRLWPRTEVALGIYNLLDRRYADPGSTEHAQTALFQDGRRLRVRLTYAF